MANFSTIPFTGGVISSGPRDLSWIEISPSKIALIYTATFNGTTRQVFIQMVTFGGSAAPVYGTPCSLGTINNLTANTFMRGAYLRDNLLVMTIPAGSYVGPGTVVPNSYTYNVVAFDAQDRFNLVSTSAAITATTNTAWPSHEMTSYNSKVYSIRRPTDSTYIFAEIVVDGANAITVTPKTTFSMVSTGVQQATAYSQRAGNIWLYQANAHGTVNTANSFAFIDLSTLTTNTVPSTSMSQSSQAGSLGRSRIPTPAGGAILDMVTSSTSFARYNLDGSQAMTASYRSAFTGGMMDVMWLDTQHFIMLNTSATTTTLDRDSAVTNGALSVQVCRYDQTTNTMTISGAPKLLGTTAPRENFGNLLHKIDESNIAVIGAYQFSTPSTHAGYGVQVLSI
ncbi:hypothetical protein D3C85_859920 [compost metagenome]